MSFDVERPVLNIVLSQTKTEQYLLDTGVYVPGVGNRTSDERDWIMRDVDAGFPSSFDGEDIYASILSLSSESDVEMTNAFLS